MAVYAAAVSRQPVALRLTLCGRLPQPAVMMTKEALRLWEERTGSRASEATDVKLNGMLPSIEKMDSALSQLTRCQSVSGRTRTGG